MIPVCWPMCRFVKCCPNKRLLRRMQMLFSCSRTCVWTKECCFVLTIEWWREVVIVFPSRSSKVWKNSVQWSGFCSVQEKKRAKFRAGQICEKKNWFQKYSVHGTLLLLQESDFEPMYGQQRRLVSRLDIECKVFRKCNKKKGDRQVQPSALLTMIGSQVSSGV